MWSALKTTFKTLFKPFYLPGRWFFSLVSRGWQWLPSYAQTGVLAVGVLGLSGFYGLHVLASGGIDMEGLVEPKRPIEVVKLDQGPFYRLLNEEQQNKFIGSSQHRCQRRALKQLGVVNHVEPNYYHPGVGSLARGPWSTAVEGAKDAWQGAFGGSDVAAFYRTGTDTIYQNRDQDVVLRHEVIHALEDQWSNRMEQLQQASTTDRRLALKAVVEGTALHFGGGREATGWYSGNFDQDSWIFIYRAGQRYLNRHVGNKLSDAFELVPEHTYPILTGDTRDQYIRPDPVELRAGERRLCSDELGALGVYSFLYAAELRAEDIALVAASWMGDRVDHFTDPEGQRKTIWTLYFDNPEAVDMWNLALTTRFGRLSDDIDIQAEVPEQTSQSTWSPFEQISTTEARP